MPLVDVAVNAPPEPLPPAVSALIADADARIARFVRDQPGGAQPGFVPSDFVRVYAVLRAVARGHLAPDRAFCEWGSGFGVVAALAAQLGFLAYGIEIADNLVDEAESLAADHGVSVDFVCGSFVPPGGEALTDRVTEFAWLDAGGADGHAALGFDPDDFGVVFAYPWPGEEDVIEELFERFGADGALLITYHGLEDVRVRRKVATA